MCIFLKLGLWTSRRLYRKSYIKYRSTLHKMARAKPERRHFLDFTHQKQGRWDGPFYFIQGADTQFGLKDSWNNVTEEEQNWQDEVELTRQAIEAINRLRPRPKFFVVCGDMIDAFPWKKYYEAQYDDFKTVFKNLDAEIPLLCVCGNHDVGDKPTAETIQSYKSKYGDDYYSFWFGGVLFIVINSQYYQDSSLVPELKKEQDLWLDEQLKLSKSAKHTVVFQHIPWFLQNPDEDSAYFNIVLTARKEMLTKLKAAGVKYVFAGHYHRNAGGYDGDLEMVVTSAIGFPIGDDKPGMRVVKVKSDKISHSFEDIESFPTKIDLES